MFDAGAAPTVTSRIEIEGTGIHAMPESARFRDAATKSGYFLITETNAEPLMIVYHHVAAIETNFGLNQMKHFKLGLEALSNMQQVNSAFGRDAIPLVGNSLSGAMKGAPPKAPAPIA